MSKGLVFSPFLEYFSNNNTSNNTSAPVDTTGNTSVPTTANDYFNFFKPPQLSPELQIGAWQPGKLESTTNFVQEVLKPHPEWNPFAELDKWNQGLRGLDKSSLQKWEEDNYPKTQGHDEIWKDRLWKNQEFIKTFGMDLFNALGAKDRDKVQEDYFLSKSLQQKYGDNNNFNVLKNLTPEGKKDVLNSEYKPDWQIKGDGSEKGWLDYSLGERWKSIDQNAARLAGEWMFNAGTVGGVIGGAGGGVIGGAGGAVAGMAMGVLGGFLGGTLTGIVHPEDGATEQVKRSENDAVLNKIVVADNERKKKDSAAEINKVFNILLKEHQNGNPEFSTEEIDKKFDELALNKEKKDELGNTLYKYNGSNYYSAFKDSYELDQLNTTAKLKQLAQARVLGEKYGSGTAMAILEQDMQDQVNKRQTGWTWLGQSVKNIGVGGLSNIMLKAVGAGGLAAYLTYGEEGLANYLEGKDASGDGTDNWINPKYWNKVDHYNTLDRDIMAKADRDGGVSLYTNVVAPGTENDFGWNTVNEAARMSKFVWGDLLVNVGLGKLLKGAVKVANGGAPVTEVAPGVLASDATTGAARFLNTWGSRGIIASSSLGIDAAYGLQTYEDVLNENERKINAIIDKDTEEEVKRRLNSPLAKEAYLKYLNDVNAKRRQDAGGGPYNEAKEGDLLDEFTTLLTNSVREEQKAKHSDALEQARKDAANAYAIDATVEGLRMATTNGVFKSYLFDKGTLNAARVNNPFVDTTFKEGEFALAKNAAHKKAAATLAANVWGGFQSNYFDDITVGLAKGYGIQDYNNYLLQKYNPAAYGEVMDEYVSPFLAAMAGAGDAAWERRSVMDGIIGALGVPFSVGYSGTFRGHKALMREAEEQAKKEGKEGKGISNWEIAANYIQNPIIDAFAKAHAATRMTEREIKRVNDAIKSNGFVFDNIQEAVTALNREEAARLGTSVLEAKDEKDRKAFTIASTLLTLKNSGVVANAQAEPDKSNWSAKKKASHAIGSGLNKIFGIQMFDSPSTPYTRARQILDDASTIDELPAYIEDTEITENDSERVQKAKRQSDLIKTFINLPENNSVVKDMSQEDKVKFAQQRLKKNADGLINMMDRVEGLQTKLENSLAARTMHPHIIQQLAFQYAMNDQWKERFSELEKKIVGSAKLNDENSVNIQEPVRKESNLLAKYGSMKGYEKEVKAQEKKVEEAEKDYEYARKKTKEPFSLEKTLKENREEKRKRRKIEALAKDALKERKNELKEMTKEKEPLAALLESGKEVVKAEEILELTPAERLRMLDDYNRADYSLEQQKEIDRAKDFLIQDGTPIEDAMLNVKDAAILNQRIEENMKSAKQIMKNPFDANIIIDALRDNRAKKIVDYFNDKIVSESFRDFLNDKEAIVSQERAINKARGYSSAILGGMLRATKEALSKGNRSQELDDKTLSIMEDAFQTVLQERLNKRGEVALVDFFVKTHDKVNHKEVRTPVAGEGESLAEGEPANAAPLEEITTERPLSRNDKRYLTYMMDYSVENGIPLEEMGEHIDTEQFNNYVEERNHSYQVNPELNERSGRYNIDGVTSLENQANQVPADYLKGLLQDTLDSFTTYKEQLDKNSEEKKVDETAGSVATPPVNPKAADNPAPVEKEGTQKKPSNSDKESNDEKEDSQERPVDDGSRNSKIINDAYALNSKILGDLKVLLEEIDSMSMDERTREEIKNTISEILSTVEVNNIKDLTAKLYSETLGANQQETPNIDNITSKLTTFDVEEAKKRKEGGKKSEQSGKQNNNDDGGAQDKSVPSVLQTVDLDSMINLPVWKDFIDKHKIPSFIQRLAELRKAESGTKGNKPIQQSQIAFLYDSELATAVKNSMGEKYREDIDSPVIMAIEITDKNKQLVEDKEIAKNLISIKTGKGKNAKSRKYQPIGIMPASDLKKYDSGDMQASAANMEAIRKRIDKSISGVQVLRYPPIEGSKNGIIQGQISVINSNTEFEKMPHTIEGTPKTGVLTLLSSNVNSVSERLVAPKDDAELDEFNKSNDPIERRKGNLYKKLRKFFIESLSVKNKRSEESENSGKKKKPNRALYFLIHKGTNDVFDKRVDIKKISESTHKDTGASIIEILKSQDGTEKAAENLISSNSRFQRLYNAFKRGVELGTGLFGKDGKVIEEKAFNTALNNFEKEVFSIIDNYLDIINGAVKVNITDDEDGQKIVNINVYSKDISGNPIHLSTLSTYLNEANGTISPSVNEYAVFIKNLILDEGGNVRLNPFKTNYELVKWQVNYNDFEIANNKDLTEDNKKAARENVYDIFDDGILEMQTTKLAYTPTNVTVNISNAMRTRLYSDKINPEHRPKSPTDSSDMLEGQLADGTLIDPDTGLPIASIFNALEKEILSGLPSEVASVIEKMIADGNERNIDKNNDSHYIINGDIHSRVTSVKYTLDGMRGKERFDSKSGWKLPSTEVGDSFDEFGRDTYNHIFDDMSEEERMKDFENYDNSTKENYNEVYTALRGLAARLLLEKGQVIVALGNRENPGKITTKGTLKVTVHKADGTTEEKTIRVAGTVDVLAVDRKGHFHIYDFKTHRPETFSKEDAKAKGYDRQLSMYAKFLEDEYGIVVDSINIIPAHVSYSTPSGKGSNGNTDYRLVREGSHQLEYKNVAEDESKFKEFKGAKFKVEKEFELTRLNNEKLVADYAYMTEDEKQAIVEAIQDQSENPGEEITETKEIKNVQPEVKEEIKTQYDDSPGSLKLEGSSLFSEALNPKHSTAQEIVEQIDPDNPDNLKNQIEQNKKDCAR